MQKPKVVIDYNSGMGDVNLSDAYLTSYHSTNKKKTKKMLSETLLHFFDIRCLNSYLLHKKKRQQHFQGGISIETYRKFNFKMSYNGRETTRNRPTDKGECSSLSLRHCCHSVKAKSVLALCYMLQKGSAL
jgi:hypothetical protein